MARTIMPADLATTVFKFGNYYSNAKRDRRDSVIYLSDTAGHPIIPKILPDRYHTASDKELHFTLDFSPFSFSKDIVKEQTPGDVPSYNLNLFPAGAADTQKIVYLPYLANNITSTTIPTGDRSVGYFMTDKLSGCNIYVDQRTNDLVCYHANAKYKPAGEVQTAMNEMHDAAKLDIDVVKASLSKANYYAKALELEKEKVKGQTERRFSGGTTVMGFRTDSGQWEFYFQTYGRIEYTPVDTSIFAKIKGKAKEIVPEDGPLKIIDSGRFWP